MTHPARVLGDAWRDQHKQVAEHQWQVFVEQVRKALIEINTKENPTA